MKIASPLLLPPEPSLQWIEVASSFQIPGIQIIGLAAPEVAEARERIRIAIESSGFELPRRRVTISLTPAGLRKSGAGLDLPMALAVLAHAGEEAPEQAGSVIALGELGLGGAIKPSEGIAAALHWACESGTPLVLIAADQRTEAFARARELLEARATRELPFALRPVATLAEAARALTELREGRLAARWSAAEMESVGESALGEAASLGSERGLLALPPVLARIAGVIAAGRHHALIVGSRGAGKSQLVEWIAALHAPADAASRQWHWIQQTRAAPEAGASPLRRVQPEVSAQALLGSGAARHGRLQLGEVSLAHGGVLIANEWLEWKRPARECLREPLERRRVSLSTAQLRCELPADFQLLATANLCPCGMAAHPQAPCRCTPAERSFYLRKASAPLLDRIDVGWVLSPSGAPSDGEEFEDLRARVRRVQGHLVARWGELPGRIEPRRLEQILARLPTDRGRPPAVLLQKALGASDASLRHRHQLLKLTLTIQTWNDLHGQSDGFGVALEEALRMRGLLTHWGEE